MGDQRLLRRTGDTEIPIPNQALEEWLSGPQCYAAIENITNQIMVAYRNFLPESELDPNVPGSGMRNLKRGVGMGIKKGPPRHIGYVLNKALSYRPTVGEPYPRFIEYGKPTKGIPGGHELERAAEMVARQRMMMAELSVTGGMSGAGTAHHQAHPARRISAQQRLRDAKMREEARRNDIAIEMEDIRHRAHKAVIQQRFANQNAARARKSERARERRRAAEQRREEQQ